MVLWLSAAAHALTVHVIRHGETEWNRQGRLQGAEDSPLTARGVDQAIATGQRLKNVHFDLAFSSPLPRAQRTAQLLLAELASPPQLRIDERLCERRFGGWEGKTWSEIQAEFADELRLSQEDASYAMPGGESRQETLARATAFFDELAATSFVRRFESPSVLLVSHSGTVTSFIKHVLGLNQAQRRSFEVRNLAINIVERKNDTWTLRTLGDCQHLEPLDHASS